MGGLQIRDGGPVDGGGPPGKAGSTRDAGAGPCRRLETETRATEPLWSGPATLAPTVEKAQGDLWACGSSSPGAG